MVPCLSSRKEWGGYQEAVLVERHTVEPSMMIIKIALPIGSQQDRAVLAQVDGPYMERSSQKYYVSSGLRDHIRPLH